MITIKKNKLIITIRTKDPAQHLTMLNRTLLNTNRRMLNSDDLFNDADTVDDIEMLMLFKEELLAKENKSKKK